MGLPQWILNNMRTTFGIREFQFNSDAGKEVFKLSPGAMQLDAHAKAVGATTIIVSVPAGKKIIFSLFRLEKVLNTGFVSATFGAATIFELLIGGNDLIDLQGSNERPVYTLTNTTAAAIDLSVISDDGGTTGLLDISFSFVDALPPAPA